MLTIVGFWWRRPLQQAARRLAGQTQAERQRRLAALQTRVVELDGAEEREICRLEREGLAIDRREDADLEAILRVWNTLEELAA